MKQTNKKVTYKMSASLINKWKYYENYPSDKTLQEIKEALQGIFKPNKWLKRGLEYEKEVYEGKHGKVSQLVKGLPKQEWKSATVEMEDFKVRFAGKTDATNEAKSFIVDLKRVDSFYPTKYDDSFQHILYFYLNPGIDKFYYVVAEGKGNEIIKNHVVEKRRPSEEDLERMVLDHIRGFKEFLEAHGLWELYKQNNVSKWRD